MTGLHPASHETIRKYYAAWEGKDWHQIDSLLAADFTFSSPLDDHISKSDFKAGCWDTQIAFIDRFDLRRVMAADNEAFVMYVCRTTNGRYVSECGTFSVWRGQGEGHRMLLWWKIKLPIRDQRGEGIANGIAHAHFLRHHV